MLESRKTRINCSWDAKALAQVLEEVERYKLSFQRTEDTFVPNMERNMKIIVWSTRGLNMQHKRDVVVETLAEFMPDMVLLMETRLDGMAAQAFWNVN